MVPQCGGGGLKKMLLPEYMDIHPHLPSEAKATTTTTGGYTQGDSQGLFPSLQGALRVPGHPSRAEAISHPFTTPKTGCHVMHSMPPTAPPLPPQHTQWKTAHGGRAHLW